MDQYPIRRQITDLESQVLSLAESLALLPADQRPLAAADLERVRDALAQLQAALDQAPHDLAEQSVRLAGKGAGAEGEDEIVWTASRTTRLYAINAALSVALTSAHVAQVVVMQALPAILADAGVVLLSPDGSTFRAIDGVGVAEASGLGQSSTPVAPVLLSDVSPFADAARTAQPVWIESREQLLARWAGWWMPAWSESGAIAAVPLVIQNRVFGVMAFRFDSPRAFTIADRAFIVVLAQQCAAALERVQLYEQARQAAALQERHRLARDLHDSVSQALYAIVLSVTAGRASLEKDLGRVARALDNVQSLAGAAQADLRALLFDLRVDSVAQTGLVSALLERAQFLRLRHGLDIRTELCAEPDLGPFCKEALYGIAREAMHNAAKHARAKRVDLILAHSTAGLVLEVQDDGVGFELGPAKPGHYGMSSMRERAGELGAQLKIETALEQGTRVVVVVPTSEASVQGGGMPRCD